MEGDLAPPSRRTSRASRHLQLADNPGRNEPGTGEINYPFLFRYIDRSATMAGSAASTSPATDDRRGPGLAEGPARAERAERRAVEATRRTGPRTAPAALRRRGRAPMPARVPAAAPARAAEGPHHRGRRRQGGGRHGARRSEEHWPGRSRAWSSPATATACRASGSRSSRRRIRCPTRRPRGRRAHPGAGAGAQPPTTSSLCLISGGGSALLRCRRTGLTLADKQAVNRALLEVRRQHHRDELRAQAPLGDQGRPARRGRRIRRGS